jgi:hypothetical protein
VAIKTHSDQVLSLVNSVNNPSETPLSTWKGCPLTRPFSPHPSRTPSTLLRRPGTRQRGVTEVNGPANLTDGGGAPGAHTPPPAWLRRDEAPRSSHIPARPCSPHPPWARQLAYVGRLGNELVEKRIAKSLSLEACELKRT